MTKPCPRAWIWPILPGAALLIADQCIKRWAEQVLRPVGVMAGIDGLFRFRYARNTGAAFSMLSDHPGLLIALNLCVIALVIALYIRMRSLPTVGRVGLMLAAFGGVGNLLDRLTYHYVVDYVELLFMRFAVFNLADVLVSVGAILTAIALLCTGRAREDC